MSEPRSSPPQPDLEDWVEAMPQDDDGFPLEAPMTWDQADLALVLCSSLHLHRDRLGLVWHAEVNDRVDYLDAQGERRWVFPDLYVVCGIPQRRSGPFRTWVQGLPPSVVFEFATASSLSKDRVLNRERYAFMGVREYFVFDVDKVDIPGVVEGWRLDTDGVYQPIPWRRLPAGERRLPSHALELELGLHPEHDAPGGLSLRAYLPGASAPLPTKREARAREALAAKDEALAAKDEALAAKDEALAEKEARIAELERRLREAREGPPLDA